MARHMSIEERLNAQNEFDEIKAKMPLLRKERKQLKYFTERNYYIGRKAEFLARIDEITNELKELSKRRHKLCEFLNKRKKSKYNGLYILETESYKLLGKSRADFTREDWRAYDRHMHRLRRAKEKANDEKKR